MIWLYLLGPVFVWLVVGSIASGKIPRNPERYSNGEYKHSLGVHIFTCAIFWPFLLGNVIGGRFKW